MINTSLTDYEMNLVTDAQVLITKNIIIQKVYSLFAELAEEYKYELNSKVPDSNNLINPKISRGENYLGLPYVMLDYPRQFGKDDVFAIRSFFWWGNFFSITLQLKGKYLQQYSSAIKNYLSKSCFADWYIGTGDNQWDHHFESNNYLPVIGEAEFNLVGNPFFKLAKKIPLASWNEASSFFTENFKMLIGTIAPTPQCGETNLLPGTPTTGFDL
jgi:hypothetical protein